MDLSKLPRLSETDKHAPPPQPETQFPQQPQQPVPEWTQPPQRETIPYRVNDPNADMGSGPQIWLSLILGIVFMMMGWTFARYLMARVSGQPFPTGVEWTMGPKQGQQVEYFELQGYTAFTDAGIFLFGLATVLEAAVLAFARKNTAMTRILVSTAFALTVGMVAFNVVVAYLLFSGGITPLMSILAIAFGGWIVMHEWQLIKQLLATAPHGPATSA